MCGWAGLFGPPSETEHALEHTITEMTRTMLHRGPDDEGIWTDAAAGIALGFRRLSIVDLSREGHQPMISESGRYVIVFNGEVYNFADIRAELEPLGHHFRGHSDTEVILAAVEQWGIERALPRFVGMFSLLLWDRRLQSVTLVRDRIGIKPLYYGWAGGTLVCGSELKALRVHPVLRAEIDPEALTRYLALGYVPAPYSILKGVHKLPAGTMLTISGPQDRVKEPVPYWSLTQHLASATPFTGSVEEAEEQLDTLLRRSVQLRMIADVPLGAFLSGGIDSSTVVALMQRIGSSRTRTFNIAFPESAFNEAPYAAAVARHLETDHTQLEVTPQHVLDLVPSIPAMFDEPFADSSQIPTYLVSQLARRQVTVSLSGDGGDELFGGYGHYTRVQSAMRSLYRLPAPLRLPLSHALARVPSERWDRALTLLSPVTRGRVSVEQINKVLALAETTHPAELSWRMRAQWWPPERVLNYQSITSPDVPPAFAVPGVSPLRAMMTLDLLAVLPDQLLVKVDRATMAVSLEGRVPLLDHRVVEFAATLPDSMLNGDGRGKYLLRRVLYRYVPRELVDRPKAGFTVPLSVWLRGPLRPWVEELLQPSSLRATGLLNEREVLRHWQYYLHNPGAGHHRLWTILQFLAWQAVAANRAALAA